MLDGARARRARDRAVVGVDELTVRAEAVRVERHTGPRSELRALFEEAEDSTAELDAYIDAGEVLVAVANGAVVGTSAADRRRGRRRDQEHGGRRGIPRARHRPLADRRGDRPDPGPRPLARSRSRRLPPTSATCASTSSPASACGRSSETPSRRSSATQPGTMVDGIPLARPRLARPATSTGAAVRRSTAGHAADAPRNLHVPASFSLRDKLRACGPACDRHAHHARRDRGYGHFGRSSTVAAPAPATALTALRSGKPASRRRSLPPTPALSCRRQRGRATRMVEWRQRQAAATAWRTAGLMARAGVMSGRARRSCVGASGSDDVQAELCVPRTKRYVSCSCSRRPPEPWITVDRSLRRGVLEATQRT